MKILLLAVSLFFSHLIFGEESFYAIASLRFFMEADNVSSATDLDLLWKKALSSSSVNELVTEAQLIYTYDPEQAEIYLEKAWQILQFNYFKGQKPTNFDEATALSKKFKKRIKPYLLSTKHPYKALLDLIFSKSRAIQNEQTFAEAGFQTIFLPHASFIRVARHLAMPGVLFKVYLDSEHRLKNERPGFEWLIDRCEGAQNIRKLIAKEKIEHFVVPDKWLYLVPMDFDQAKQPLILMVTDMDLASYDEIVEAWKTKITQKHLDELYLILSHGYASAYLVANIPYTKNGKFACIDTEYVKRKINYKKVRPFLSEEMAIYWDKIVLQGGK